MRLTNCIALHCIEWNYLCASNLDKLLSATPTTTTTIATTTNDLKCCCCIWLWAFQHINKLHMQQLIKSHSSLRQHARQQQRQKQHRHWAQGSPRPVTRSTLTLRCLAASLFRSLSLLLLFFLYPSPYLLPFLLALQLHTCSSSSAFKQQNYSRRFIQSLPLFLLAFWAKQK